MTKQRAVAPSSCAPRSGSSCLPRRRRLPPGPGPPSRAPLRSASAVRDFLDDDDLRASRVMVSFSNDDDFIFFHVPASGVAAATDGEITEMVTRLQRHVAGQIEEAHGEDIAALFDIYVGRAHLYYNPKIRLERVI